MISEKMETERTNPRSSRIDRKSSLEIVRLINVEDRAVPYAIGRELRKIAEIVDGVVEALQSGGRVFYIGAGTSGRLGVLDASEMSPTFGVSESTFQGVVAGGAVALRRSVEGAEDDPKAGASELRRRRFSGRDALIGLSASGRTPFVLGAVKEAKRIGARTFGVTCNPGSLLCRLADCTVAIRVGPEVVGGSSRMKCGTAQKMVLNIISTASMIRLGKVHGNLMICLRPKSEKLKDRAIRIVSHIARVNASQAAAALKESEGDVKCAVVMAKHRVSKRLARSLLHKTGGNLDQVADLMKQARRKR